ncbi:MAG: glycosyltransferase [Calditrichaeota bacterium]|nr:MAG: glycosyltransferase [Calditrichota bacterium]
MKIGFLSVFYPFRGGIAQFNANLFREFEKKHEIKAWNFTRQYPEILFPGKSQFVAENDTADAIPSQRTLDTINPLTWYKTATAVKKFAPDVLFTRLWMPFFSPSLGTVAASVRKKGTKTIALLDNVLPHERRPGDHALIRYYLKRHDGFIVMTESVKSDLQTFLPNAKILLKPHPIYSHFGESVPIAKARTALGLPTDKKIILFFGFIRGYKGLDILIEAMKNLPEDYHLLIAGEVYGDYSPYENLIEKFKLNSRVHQFVEYIEDEKVPLLFSAADLCVLPYRSATQSGIAQIAWHYHLPLLVSQVGGLAEMVDEGETGLILDELNATALAKKIMLYYENNLKDQFSINMEKQRDQYSWPGFTDAMIDFVKKI